MLAASGPRPSIGTESSVVHELCSSAGGMRPQPTPEQLRVFVQQASQLDPETIALELSQQLVGPAWQTRVRACSAIQAAAEAVSKSGGDHPLALAIATLASMPETFDSVLTHSNPAVRQAACACAAALGFPAAGGAEAPSAVPHPMAEPAADLLGGSGDADGVSAQAPAAASNALGDLLGGDVVGSEQPQQQQQHAQQAQSDMDLLGGLEGGAPAAPGGAAHGEAWAPPNAQQQAPLQDMFAGLDIAGPSSPQDANCLDDLLYAEPVPAAPQASSTPPAAASQAAGQAAAHVSSAVTSSSPASAFAAWHPPAAPAPTTLPPAWGQSGQATAVQGAAHGVVPAQGQYMTGVGVLLPTGGGWTPGAPAQSEMPSVGAGATDWQAGSHAHAAALSQRQLSLGTRQLGKGPSKPKDAFDFVNEAMHSTRK
jgi:hypothetical protein